MTISNAVVRRPRAAAAKTSPRKAPRAEVRATPRTQSERREESDARMIRAGTKLIAKNGIAGTTLADIGVSAGYSRGLPVYAFGTKDKFVVALLKSMQVVFEERLHENVQGLTGLKALRARVKTHFYSLRRDPIAIAALFSIFSESFFGNETLKAEVAHFVGQWRRGFARHLEEAWKAGEIRKVDFEEHGAIYVALVRGVSMEFLMSNRKLDLDALESTILDFIEHSLSAA